MPDAFRVEKLSKDFESGAGRYAVLRDVSLAVTEGEFLCVLGPSGSGKSTLLNVMAGLEAPDAGWVHVHGQPPGGRPPVAYMQQKDLLLPWRTLWQNILLGPELASREVRQQQEPRARELLGSFQLQGFANAYPAQLSGGMRQRAALIRTLLCGRRYLLLDEPFGALDALTRTRLQQLLLGVWRELGLTIVLVTHDVEEALRLATRIVLLSSRPGRISGEYALPWPHDQRRVAGEVLELKERILAMLLDAPDEEPWYEA